MQFIIQKGESMKKSGMHNNIKKDMKNGMGKLRLMGRLMVMAVLVAGTYWLSYGMTSAGYRVTQASDKAVKEAVAAAEAECKSGAGICKSPETILRESREAGAIAAETVQAQLNQEAIARGQKPTISRTGATQPIVAAVGGAAVALPNLKGPRKFAALIIDDQYDFMTLPFIDNALGGNEDRRKNGGRLAVTQADQAMIDDTVQFLSGWKKRDTGENRDRIFSQDWHPAGHVSHDTTFVKKTSIGTAKPEYAPQFVPLGDSAKDYVAVGAPGVPGGCVGVEAVEADMTDKVAVNPTQVIWPVHCVQGTVGAEIPNDMFENRSYADIKSKKIADGLYGDPVTHEYIVQKGYHCSVDSYSAFLDVDKKTQTALFKFLAQKGITDIAIMGIANDYCVGSSAEDAINGGLNVHYIGNLSRGVDPAGMVKKFQHLSKLKGPNGARLVFYDLTDINDQGYSKNLLTKAGLWPITEKMTTAQFYALVDAIEASKPAIAPAKPAAPVAPAPAAPVYIATSEEEPTEGFGESTEYPIHEDLMARYKSQQKQNIDLPESIADWKTEREDELKYYVEKKSPKGGSFTFLSLEDEDTNRRIGFRIVTNDKVVEYGVNGKRYEETFLAPAVPTPAAPTAPIETPKEEPTFGWSEEEEEENPTVVSTPVPAATGQAAGLEKKYKAQMTKDAPVKLLDLSKKLAEGTATFAGNYVEISEGLKRQVFMKKADGGYKIEFKNSTYEFDAQGNLIAPVAQAAPVAPAGSKGPEVSEATLAARYEEQKDMDITTAPNLEKATIDRTAGSYISTSVEKGAPRYFKIQPDGGYKIEFKNATFEYGNNKELIIPEVPVVAPVAEAAPVSQPKSLSELLAIDPFASMPK